MTKAEKITEYICFAFFYWFLLGIDVIYWNQVMGLTIEISIILSIPISIIQLLLLIGFLEILTEED